MTESEYQPIYLAAKLKGDLLFTLAILDAIALLVLLLVWNGA